MRSAGSDTQAENAKHQQTPRAETLVLLAVEHSPICGHLPWVCIDLCY